MTAVVAEGDFEARSIGSFTVRLYSTENAQPGDDTTFFVGGVDLYLVRAGLDFANYFIRTLNAWNLSAQLTALSELDHSQSLTAETLLRNYPSLLTFQDATQLAPAREALNSAIDDYVQGAGLIRSRPPGLTRLFNVDRPDLESEERFRQSLLDLKASISETVTISEAPEFQVTMGQLFDETTSPRAWLPAFKTNSPDPATLPTQKYAAAIQSQGAPVILFQPIARSAFEIGVFAVGKEPLRFQWQKAGIDLPGATNSILEFASVGVAGTNQLRVVVSNDLGSVASKPIQVTTTIGYLLWSAKLAPDSQAGLSLRGPAGIQVVIETSPDLRKWTPAATNEMPGNGTLTLPPLSAGTGRLFFRAIAE